MSNFGAKVTVCIFFHMCAVVLRYTVLLYTCIYGNIELRVGADTFMLVVINSMLRWPECTQVLFKVIMRP